MNELTIKGVKVDLPEIVEIVNSKAREYATIKVDENNYLYVEAQRKNLTTILDNYRHVLVQGEEEYLQPFKSLVEPLKNALDTLSQQEKRLMESVLYEKKKAFREEVKAEFYQLCELACRDGVIPNFDEIYEEKWYGKPKKTWRESLLKKLDKATREDKPLTAYIIIDSVESEIELVKQFLFEHKIVFRIETVEGE